MQTTLTGLPKRDIEEAFKGGIPYTAPRPLVGTSGSDWVFQPHRELYETIATNVLEHYDHYKKNKIDKTYIPAYFYLGGAGTGKSRHASEFASSVKAAIKSHTQHSHRDELAERLENAFIFHVSFENGTSLTAKEMSDPWYAIGTRMLHQLLGEDVEKIGRRYVASPRDIFRLVAAAQNVDLYDNFTGILVVDGIQKALKGDNDGRNNTSTFYGLLGQIGDLSLMSRDLSKTEGGTPRQAPFIMTCVTATCFGPIQDFLGDSHRKRVFLPLNRLVAPTWKKDHSPVFNDSPVIRLLVNDVGGHARAMELIADLLTEYPKNLEPNIAEFTNRLHEILMDRYGEAISVIEHHTLSIVQCILSRQPILLRGLIPGSTLQWEHVTASGLIWFEKTETNYDAHGYLVAPYIWLWMLARLKLSEDTRRLRQFLQDWQFNDYADLLHLMAGKGSLGNSTWQSFEVFCCSFRRLRSLGFEDGQEVPLKLLHSGCKLQDDKNTMVVNRHLDFAEAVHQYRTDSMTKKHTTTRKAQSAEEVVTLHSGTLNADAQLSYVILNGASASAGDFFLSVEIPTQRAPGEKASLGKPVREVGQCKLIQDGLTQAKYNAERNKSAGPDDIFILYTKTKISKDCTLPDRSGFVDASCWDSYFGPFSGRAYMALQRSRSKEKNDQT
jgi:hypothetical protein